MSVKNVVGKVPTRTVTSDMKNDYDPRPESDRDKRVGEGKVFT